ncbi:MAG: Ulp1 family isopeptidase [Legionella sp.]|nr:Ulp1 family isopeptidase [Legionella sp.]
MTGKRSREFTDSDDFELPAKRVCTASQYTLQSETELATFEDLYEHLRMESETELMESVTNTFNNKNLPSFAAQLGALNQKLLAAQRSCSPLPMKIIQLLLCQLTMYVKSLDSTPAPALRQQLGQLANICFITLHDTLTDETAFTNWIETITVSDPDKTIAYLIYDCGFLAKYKEYHFLAIEKKPVFPDLPPLFSTHLERILKTMGNLVEPREEFCSILLKGCGWLAQANKLTGPVSLSALTALLQSFKTNVYCISNAFYSMGLMANVKFLTDKIDGEILTQILCKPDNSQWNSQAVSNCLLAIAALAQTNLLEGHFDLSMLLALMNKLNSNPLSISNSLLALGELAKNQQLRGTLSATFVEKLLRKVIACRNISVTTARRCLDGLASLEASGIMNGEVDKSILLPLKIRVESVSIELPTILLPVNTLPASSTLTRSEPALSFADSETPSSATTLSIPEAPTPIARRSRSFEQLPPRSSAATTRPRQSLRRSQPLSPRIDNAIYKAIESKDINGLETLLNLVLGESNKSIRVSSEKTGSNRTKKTGNRFFNNFMARAVNNNEHTDNLVIAFFDSIPPETLQELASGSEARYFNLLLAATSPRIRYELGKNKKLNPILLGLSIEELKLFVNSFLPLQVGNHYALKPLSLYRDSTALTSILDALSVRKDEHTNDHEIINKLQKDLITKGLEFHSQRMHSNVLDTLKSYKSRTGITSTPTPANTVRERPIPTPIIPPVAPPPPQVPVRIAATLCINNDYQYEDVDINIILTARVREFKNIHVLAAANMNADEEQNRIEDVLQSFLAQTGNDPQQLLLPIHVGGHWIGLRLKIKHKKITEISYYNSLQDQDNDITTTIKNQLRTAELIKDDLQIKQPHINMQQPDGTSCGPVLIENFYCDLKKQWWQKEAKLPIEQIKTIRSIHLKILEKYHPEFYHSFNPKQAHNIPSAISLTAQRQRYHFHAAGSTSTAQERPESTECRMG